MGSRYQVLKESPEGQKQQELLGGPRDFHSHWCCCFGDCDGPGWGACCLSSFLPCVAIGWNLQRASGSQRLGWGVGLLFFTLLVLVIVIQMFCKTCTTVQYHCPDRGQGDICETEVCSVRGAPAIGLCAFAVVALAIKLASRRYIRRVLNLDSLQHEPLGVFCCDFWSHCLGRCGLCQETRTMMINNVEDGVWNGPSKMVAYERTVSH